MRAFDIAIESDEILLGIGRRIFVFPNHRLGFSVVCYPMPPNLGITNLISSGRISEFEASFQIRLIEGIPINQRPFLILF